MCLLKQNKILKRSDSHIRQCKVHAVNDKVFFFYLFIVSLFDRDNTEHG